MLGGDGGGGGGVCVREGCEGRVTVGEAWCRRLCRGGVGCVGEVGRGGGCWHCGVCVNKEI